MQLKIGVNKVEKRNDRLEGTSKKNLIEIFI